MAPTPKPFTTEEMRDLASTLNRDYDDTHDALVYAADIIDAQDKEIERLREQVNHWCEMSNLGGKRVRNLEQQLAAANRHIALSSAHECIISSSSRICERGTKACDVRHALSPTKEK